MNKLFIKHTFLVISFLFIFFYNISAQENQKEWIRINRMGYAPKGIKVAILAIKGDLKISKFFELYDVDTRKSVLRKKIGGNYGAYGHFKTAYRLDFTGHQLSGRYYLQVGKTVSMPFQISDQVYKGAADFVLRYLRQQRSGYNPCLMDSCHTKDGVIVYGPVPELTRIDASGGWHDASDYLQYVTTTANASYHLLAAYRDFPSVFMDQHQANGLAGANGIPDVLDEGKWGLQWLLKMHPRKDWMFNQLGDDRDHAGMRLPTKDSVDYGYGKANGRPVYFITGKPQGLGQYKNKSTGAASTAGKFASAFALGAQTYHTKEPVFAALLAKHSISAFNYGLAKPGVAQTASTLSPYIYAEDNWVDDMELGAAALYSLHGDQKYLQSALNYSKQEKITPWLGTDTASNYQWYPFHNFGHYELAKMSNKADKKQLIDYYKQGVDRVWKKASTNAFYRGIPFIWCSNNLTVSFAIQCYLYRKLSGDLIYAALEQASFDWIFGCNPWGKSMVYGMPENGDYPRFPHSSLTELYNYPLDGGLVDGPVYTTIFNSLRGIKLDRQDKYAAFQSALAVYHDDGGDYSTNEPTMDGSVSLVYLMAAMENEIKTSK